MYNWRKMTDEQRDEILTLRQGGGLPWHGPPCEKDTNWYHLSAANFEHKNIIGITPERMLATLAIFKCFAFSAINR